ncbi:hypothetical protein JCGZ_19182 [Jatropha curcas]|uniref:Uncharacterized protein n=1 Tax=Jatropha curcas TaxID=180498 RepID=A0A067LI98_JATCU|nr:hypothetical protein JCGZ_19182 [Jatropha curcas]
MDEMHHSSSFVDVDLKTCPGGVTVPLRHLKSERIVPVDGFNWGYFDCPSTIMKFEGRTDCTIVIVGGLCSYLGPVEDFNYGYFDRPSTITTFDRWTNCAMVIVDDFCGYLVPFDSFELIMLHFGRLSFRTKRGEIRAPHKMVSRVRHFRRLQWMNDSDNLVDPIFEMLHFR